MPVDKPNLYQPVRILIADDDSITLTIFETFANLVYQTSDDFRGRTLEITKVKSGTEAISKLLKQPFDLVLLDMNMPDSFGSELLEKISSLKTEFRFLQDCRFYAMSSTSKEFYEDRGIAFGKTEIDAKDEMDTTDLRFSGYLKKPFKPTEIQSFLSRESSS